MDESQQLVLTRSGSLIGPIRGIPRGTLVDATLERRILAPARALGMELQPFGVTPIPGVYTGPSEVQDATGGYWILAMQIDDPTLRRGKIPVPRAELEKLEHLYDGGVELDYVVVGHEMPKEWRPGDPLPPLVPPAPRVTTAERAMGATVELLLGAVRWAVSSAAQAIRTAWQILPPGFDAGLDPVILGGVVTDDGARVAWAVIASWTWEA